MDGEPFNSPASIIYSTLSRISFFTSLIDFAKGSPDKFTEVITKGISFFLIISVKSCFGIRIHILSFEEIH